ncbi:MAG: hypothetical protein HY865_02370 [Chloroflexi bacterium]|nr:hypothetical protein [Chloroflexota bacterium]
MSIYDNREEPAYRPVEFDLQYAKNPHILKWWSPEHDNILSEQIAAKQWAWWSGKVTDEIVKSTDKKIIGTWKTTDPVCKKYAWYNVLLYFAGARAKQLGLEKAIRYPQWKVCPLCNQKFIEDSLPLPLIDRLGIDKIDFCSPCLQDKIFPNTGDNYASGEKIKKYLIELSSTIGRVPPQAFGEGATDFIDLSTDERLSLLRVLQNKPTSSRVKKLFGSWLNALIQAGVLEDGTRKTSRGIHTVATDGHVCLSLGEKTIDEFLYSRRIQHEKEPRYPEGKYRGDFKVGDIFIEYFGLTGNLEYDMKTKEKIRLCKKHGVTLIAIYPEDFVSQQRLENKLSFLIGKTSREP